MDFLILVGKGFLIYMGIALGSVFTLGAIICLTETDLLDWLFVGIIFWGLGHLW